MKYILLSAIGAFFVVFTLSASQLFEHQKIPGTDKISRGKAIPNSKDSKVRDGFGAQFFITADSTIFDRWERPSEGFSITRMKKIEIGKNFFPSIIFHNPKRDRSGRVRVSYILKVYKPNGDLYFEEYILAWDGMPRHSGMELNQGYITVSMEKSDPLGVYNVKALVRDENSMTDLELETDFELVGKTSEAKESVKTLSDREIDMLLTYFYRDRKIDQIPILLRQLADKKGVLDRHYNLKYFFSEVYRLYPERIGEGAAAISNSGKGFNHFFLDSVWQSDTNEANAYLKKRLGEKGRDDNAYIKALLKKRPENLIDNFVTSPSDLDSLWGAYFGSGEDKYLKKIISNLVLSKSNSTNDKLIQGAARWSVVSNCKQHEKVLSYVKSEAREGDWPIEYKNEFISILNELKI